MIFRRIAVLAVAGVLTLAPIAGHALGDAAGAISGTKCTLGNETLTYDAVAFDWLASSTILCAETYSQLALSVSAVLVQPQRNSVAIAESGVICLVCPALQHRVARGGPWMTTGVYQVRSTGYVSVQGRPWLVAEHFSCFFVNGFEAKPLMAGCPKIN